MSSVVAAIQLSEGRRASPELTEKVLDLARARTGLEIAAILRFEQGGTVVGAILGSPKGLALVVGSKLPGGSSLAELVVDGRLPSVIADTGAHTLTKQLPLTSELGIRSFVGAPIPGTGTSPQGMLVCLSRSVSPTLDDTDAGFLERLAGVIAAIVDGGDDGSERRRRVRDRVGRVLRHDRLRAVFQPIMRLDTGRVVGAEALTRFPAEPSRPDLWFADAESVGLGTALELAAIAKAVAQLDALPPDTYLSVNASPTTLCSPELHTVLADLDTHRLVVELTEHAPVDDYDDLAGAVHRLRGIGVRLAIDDVGAGFSSLTHVLRLAPDIVKLDIAITRGLHLDPARRGVARGLVSLARDIGATVVAEGVECQEELDVLLDLGVDAAQGYHLARPGRLPLPTDLPRPTGRLLHGVSGTRDDHDVLGFIARTWLDARDLESMARPVLDAVLDRTGLQTSFLTAIDAATGALEYRYVRNIGPIELPEGAVVPWDDTLCKRCQDAGIRWTSDAPVDLPGAGAAEAFGIKTFLSVPVPGPDGTVLGTLCAASTEQRYVGSEVLDEIELLARLVGDRWDHATGGGSSEAT